MADDAVRSAGAPRLLVLSHAVGVRGQRFRRRTTRERRRTSGRPGRSAPTWPGGSRPSGPTSTPRRTSCEAALTPDAGDAGAGAARPSSPRLLAGRPEAARAGGAAAGQPGGAAGAGRRATRKAGTGTTAEARFAALPQQGLTQVLRPLLVAWAQQGRGAPTRRWPRCAPFVEGQRFRGVYALHAAMIADLGGRTAEAARLYRIAADRITAR